jgi:hypothetical protein
MRRAYLTPIYRPHHRRPERRITEWLAVAFTALLFAANVGMWWETHRLVTEGKESSRTELRAYISFNADSYVITPGAPVEVHATFKNAGRTPAYNFRSHASIVVFPIPIPLKVGLVVADSDRSGGMMTIGSEAEVPVSFVGLAPFGDSEAAAMKSGTQTIYIVGLATYSDIFGEKHETSFCAMARGPWVTPPPPPVPLVPPEPDIRTFRFFACDVMNGAT